MSLNRPNLTLDEQSFEGLLSAAFTIQEHNDRRREALESVSDTAAVARAVCRHCGGLKAAEDGRCLSCGLDEFRPGERLQRNWAAMWLRSQFPDEWPERPVGVAPQIRRSIDAAEDLAEDELRFAEPPFFNSEVRTGNDSSSSMAITTDAAGANANLFHTPDSGEVTNFEANFETSLESTFDPELDSGFDPEFDPAISGDAVPEASWFRHFSDWRVKLRFRRADLYVGLAIVVAVTALLWPAAVSSRPATLDPWERALVMLGIAEVPAPLVHLQGDPNVNVWIDTHTALYYCPGEEQYEKTSDGRLSSQREAQMDRFEPASRTACE